MSSIANGRNQRKGAIFLRQNADSQAGQAYHALEALIVTLDLRPGSFVTEKYLVERVRLGRTPVREAIQQLSWEGLIEVRPRNGVFIADMRPEDYASVLQPRMALEPILARSAANYADDYIRSKLEQCAREMLEHASANDTMGFLRADKSFDEVLDEACPNKYLTKVLKPLQTHSRRFWFRYNSFGGPSTAAAHHLDVMKAIQQNDQNAAEEKMRSLMIFLNRCASNIMARPEMT
ncbi:MAG: GntR family transcriptional regulator [Rhizobiales bacterium]|nr:GntR family transcriptional regulator [Hyphomicrobiales bacterium]